MTATLIFAPVDTMLDTHFKSICYLEKTRTLDRIWKAES